MEIGLISAMVKVLSEVGLSPIGILFAVTISVIIWRSWKREDSFAQRQHEFNRATDEELKRLRAAHERCEQDVEKLHRSNLTLDRWKAICEDSCVHAEKLHKLTNHWNESGGGNGH